MKTERRDIAHRVAGKQGLPIEPGVVLRSARAWRSIVRRLSPCTVEAIASPLWNRGAHREGACPLECRNRYRFQLAFDRVDRIAVSPSRLPARRHPSATVARYTSKLRATCGTRVERCGSAGGMNGRHRRQWTTIRGNRNARRLARRRQSIEEKRGSGRTPEEEERNRRTEVGRTSDRDRATETKPLSAQGQRDGQRAGRQHPAHRAASAGSAAGALPAAAEVRSDPS